MNSEALKTHSQCWIAIFLATQHSLVFVGVQLLERLNELDKQQTIVVICHHGMRSQQAALYLEHAGFNNLANLHGGIDAWSVYCEPSVPRY